MKHFLDSAAPLLSPYGLIAGLIIYLLYAMALFTIAMKLGHRAAWLAFIPLANFWLLLDLGQQPSWLIIIVIIPVVNILSLIIIALATERICKRLELSTFLSGILGILSVMPIVSLFVWISLALTTSKTQATSIS